MLWNGNECGKNKSNKIEDVLVKLNVRLLWLKLHSTKRWLFSLFTSTMDLELRKKLVKCYIWSIGLYGAETWTLRADQKHMESFEMWCWRRMGKISWTYHVRNEEVLLRVKEQRNILHEIRKRSLTGLVTFCVETAFYNGLLKERQKGG